MALEDRKQFNQSRRTQVVLISALTGLTFAAASYFAVPHSQPLAVAAGIISGVNLVTGGIFLSKSNAYTLVQDDAMKATQTTTHVTWKHVVNKHEMRLRGQIDRYHRALNKQHA